MSERNRSFWSSVPGFVTGLAGLLTAIVGLVTVLIQLDVIGGDDSKDDGPAVTTTVAGGAQGAGAGGAAGPATTEAPQFTVSPTTVDFAAAREKTVRVKNDGRTALSLSPPSLTGKDAAQFQASLGTCTGSLGSGLSCDLKVTFTPSGPLRTYEARLQVVAPGAPGKEVNLTATTLLG